MHNGMSRNKGRIITQSIQSTVQLYKPFITDKTVIQLQRHIIWKVPLSRERLGKFPRHSIFTLYDNVYCWLAKEYPIVKKFILAQNQLYMGAESTLQGSRVNFTCHALLNIKRALVLQNLVYYSTHAQHMEFTVALRFGKLY